MKIQRRIETLTLKLTSELLATDEKQIEKFIRFILTSKRIFLLGAGRSGLAAQAFAMRLMHLNRPVYVVGEIVTPPISRGDLLIAVSGSGSTGSVVHIAKIAKAQGAKLAAVTSYPNSPLARIANFTLVVKGRSPAKIQLGYTARQLKGSEVKAPLGTLFELSCHILFDAIIEELMERTRIGERKMKKRHTNLE